MAKKGKKVIKDSVDVDQSKQSEEVQVQQEKNNDKKAKRSFGEKYKDFVTEHKVPILSYCYVLFHRDLLAYKKDPKGQSTDSKFLKNLTNKKRFWLKLSYLIGMFVLAIALIAIAILWLTNVIPNGSELINGQYISSNVSKYVSGGLMAIAFIILGILI